jgi:hypothetical protein
LIERRRRNRGEKEGDENDADEEEGENDAVTHLPSGKDERKAIDNTTDTSPCWTSREKWRDDRFYESGLVYRRNTMIGEIQWRGSLCRLMLNRDVAV